MKRLTKLISMLLVLSFAVLLCVGCGNEVNKEPDVVDEVVDNEFKYSVAHAESYNLEDAEKIIGDDVSKDGFSTELVKGYSNLLEYSSNSKLPFFDKASSEYNSTLSKQVRTYDSTYFEENALVFVYAYKQINEYIDTLNVNIMDDTLKIALTVPGYVYDGTEEELVYIYLVEVSQFGLSAVTKVEVLAATKGCLYQLDYAYTLGLVDDKEVASIAYHFYEGKAFQGQYTEGMEISLDDFVETDYEPIAITPKELSVETTNQIKETVSESLVTELQSHSTRDEIPEFFLPEKIIMVSYLGTYDDCVAFVWLTNNMHGLATEKAYCLGDTTFYHEKWGLDIYIWKAV